MTFNNNIFLNKELFYQHHNKKYRKNRINDFLQIYNILKNHLVPQELAKINKKKMEEYINLHKKENQYLIKKILNNIQHVTFKNFIKNLSYQIEKFNNYLKDNNIKKYVFSIGVGNDFGASTTDFNIYKSNLWVFMLAYKFLKVKPYDICLNLNTSIRLYYPEIKDYLILDDCSYSGDQVVNNVLKVASTELMYFDDNNFLASSLTKKAIFQPVQQKKCNIHLVIPYISKVANNKINDLELTTAFNIIKYVSYIINPFKDILDYDLITKINSLYKKFYSYVDFGNLTPIFFEHKIADMISTIDLMLIKGQVLDNPEKKLVFVGACMYDKNNVEKHDLNPKIEGFIHNKIYCPNPPYIYFEKLLKEKLN